MTVEDYVPPPIEPTPSYVPAPPRRRIAMPPGVKRWGEVLGPRLRPNKTTSLTADLLTWAFGLLSFLLAWFVFFTLVVSALQHGHRQSVLYSKLREQLAPSNETAPLGGAIAPGQPIGLIEFPTGHLHNEVIVEGTASGDLIAGPGHRRDTPLPGQAGVSVVYGRSTLFGGPFGHITQAHPGDVITVTTGEGEATFIVRDIRHAGDQLPAWTTGRGWLMLVTSEGGGWRSGWASSRAVYVDAEMQGAVFGTPPGRPTSVPKAEQAMHGDTSALFELVLWLPVLLIGIVGSIWAHARWGKWESWLVGVPVVLAGLWGVSETAVQLMPNLL